MERRGALMISGAASVVLITREHLIAATVTTAGKRVLDVLNDSLTDYLQVFDVQVFRDMEMQQPIATFPSVWVQKSALSMIILPEERHEAPERRLYNFVQKTPRHVFVIVPGYEVEGSLHLARSARAETTLTHDLGDFFPITQAKVVQVGSLLEATEVPVVIIHKPMMLLFSLDESA